MEWTDDALVLSVRAHGESSAILEVLTRAHGRHLGLVRGGAGKRMRPMLQPLKKHERWVRRQVQYRNLLHITAFSLKP